MGWALRRSQLKNAKLKDSEQVTWEKGKQELGDAQKGWNI